MRAAAADAVCRTAISVVQCSVILLMLPLMMKKIMLLFLLVLL